MANFRSMHALFPLSIAFCLSAHVAVAAARKLHVQKLPTTNTRALMSSSTFYNAFDTDNPNFHHNADREETNVKYGDAANKFFDNNFVANTDPQSYTNDANLPLNSAASGQPNTGRQSGYLNAYDFSTRSPSLPSMYRGSSPYSFEYAFTHPRDGYGKQSFPSQNPQASLGSLNEKGSLYSSPLIEDHASPSKEKTSVQSPSNFGRNYGHPQASVTDSKAPQLDRLDGSHNKDAITNKNNAFGYGFRNEKPVTNYDRFFDRPTIHKNDVEGSTIPSPFGHSNFPVSENGLTYGHVQVP